MNVVRLVNSNSNVYLIFIITFRCVEHTTPFTDIYVETPRLVN
jgi:hypothetical protein